MKRRTFDKIASIGGVAAVVTFAIAGGLLLWGHSFVNNNVHNQLAMQQIYFPPNSVWASATKNNTGEIQQRMIPYLKQYSGQELLTGPQAEAYADHFIAYHMAGMPYGGVYSKVSAAAMAAKPGSAAATNLHQLETTVFQGTTLRGLLLEGYAFWKIGEVMLWGALICFTLAGILAVLTGFGFWHANKTVREEEMFVPKAQPEVAVPA
jgi:hypothetical protein